MAGAGRAVDGDGGAGEGEVNGCAILLGDVIGTVKVLVEGDVVGRLDTPARRVDDLTSVVVERGWAISSGRIENEVSLRRFDTRCCATRR